MRAVEPDLLARGGLRTDLFIAGSWCAPAHGQSFPVENPATGDVVARVADAGPLDAVAALDAACLSAEGWASSTPRTRAELLHRAFEALLSRSEDFAYLITTEMGKPLAESRSEIAYAADFLRWFAEEAVRLPGRFGRSPDGDTQMLVTARPVGPCYLITPWNFPLAMATRKIAPALAAGCTVVLKPADATPLTALLFADLLTEIGLPSGVVNVVPSSRPAEVSAAIFEDSRLRKISFTGSTGVGRQLLSQAADRVLRTSMELGGNAPFIVFADANLDAAIEGAIQAKFRNAGQACTAANRFLIHERVVDAFTKGLNERVAALTVGPGQDPATNVGPLIDQRAVAKVSGLVDDAVAGGAQLLAGGHALIGPGCFFEPTVLTGVSPDSDIARQEIFGPVVTLSEFGDEREAVQLANDTEYGLASYVYTQDLGRAHRMITALDAGMTAINVGSVSNAAAPFGGAKQSGLGREGGAEGIHEYLEVKYATVGFPSTPDEQ
jgi:succinate-semialdehyde dehydrogenase/glutarate-semialdehyde dehydrogenase